MNTLTVKQGDLLPTVQARLTVTLADGSVLPAPLAGATVRFRMQAVGGGALKVNATATVIDGSTATVQYTWAGTDTDTSGTFLAEFDVTYSGSIPESFPNSEYILITIVPGLVAGRSTWPSPLELGFYLQEDIAPDDPKALLVLNAAKGAVQADLQQTVEFVPNEIVKMTGKGSNLLLLPQIPVTALTSVVVDGETLVQGDDYRWDPRGLLWRLDTKSWWGTPVTTSQWSYVGALIPTGFLKRVWMPASTILVTYSHGYATIPDAIRAIVLEAAARVYGNPQALASESIGHYSVRYARGTRGPGGVTLSADEKLALDNFRAGQGVA